MPLQKKIVTLALAGLLCSTTPCMSQDDTTSDTSTSMQHDTQMLPAITRGSKLMGLDVIASLDGTRLGKLEDVVLSSDGKLAVGLVRLQSGSIGDVGEWIEAAALSGVPMSMLSLRLTPVEDRDTADDDGSTDYPENRMLIEDPQEDGEREQQLVCRTATLLESAPALGSIDDLDTAWLTDVGATILQSVITPASSIV